MRRSSLRRLLGFGQALVFGPALGLSARVAAASEYQCPPSIKTVQSIEQTPRQWQAQPERFNPVTVFDQIAIFDGPPEQGASRMPDNAESDGREPTRWAIEPDSKRGNYVACLYRRTLMILVQKVDPSMSSCQVATQDPRRLVCKK